MTLDKNKKITAITYNHLNLPTKIVFTTGNIVYIYNAAGQKVHKVVTTITPASVVTTDYLGGYQYKNTVMQFFPTAEGYVKNTPVSGTNTYSYVFNYTDHLGNTRLSYTKNPSTNALTILEENNYYPFGLKHNGYNPISPVPENRRLFNGKELQEELGLNMYDYGARNYDPSLVRWMNVDPLAETSRRFSPYTYALNNPVLFIDPDGMQATYNWAEHDKGNKGVYTDDKTKENVSFETALSQANEGSSSPTDWIKNNETGEVKWFDGTGQKAVDSANKQWGFFYSKGKTTNLGSSFFGTTGESDSDSYQIKNEQLRYLLAVSNKINKMAGVNQSQDLLGGCNLAFEYLQSAFFGVPFGKSSNKSSDLPGVIWDYGGSVEADKYFGKSIISKTALTLFDVYMSSQSLGVGSDRATHLRANAVNYFKTNTVNYITPATLFSINLHKF